MNVTFTEEILNGKLHFLCSDKYSKKRREGRSLDKVILEDERKTLE